MEGTKDQRGKNKHRKTKNQDDLLPTMTACDGGGGGGRDQDVDLLLSGPKEMKTTRAVLVCNFQGLTHKHT